MLIARSVHPLPGESERAARLLGLVDGFGSKRLLVIGDLIADEFIFGRVARVSREAPVLILQYDATEIVAGGAGNAANNAAALGARVALAGVIGASGRRGDEAGQRVVRSFPRRIDTSGLLRIRGVQTPVKTRILAGGVHSAKQQVVRIDRTAPFVLDDKSRAAFARRLDRLVADCDGVLISDYGSGLVTPMLVGHLQKRLRTRTRRRPVPILIDSRYALLKYRGLAACTPNESEVEQMLGVRVGDNRRTLERAGRAILRKTRMGAVLITRGSRGMA